MARINQNKLSKTIAEKEKGSEVNIGNIKEIQKLLLIELNKEWKNGNASGVVQLIESVK